MTVPRFVDCHCGHNKMSHEVETAPSCVHEGCGCSSYRARSGPPAGPSAGPAEQLLAVGKRSEVKTIARLAERIDDMLRDLRARLEADRIAAVARAEVQRLEKELAAAKAKLNGRPSSANTPGFHCPEADCDRTFPTTQARALHHRRAHQGFNPGARKTEGAT